MSYIQTPNRVNEAEPKLSISELASLDAYLSKPSDSGIQNLLNTQSNFAFNRWKNNF